MARKKKQKRVKNPKPRIGSGKSLERPFEPSKKLRSQFPKLEETVEKRRQKRIAKERAERPGKSWQETNEERLKQLARDKAAGKLKGSFQPIDYLPRDLRIELTDELAILNNIYDEDTAEFLDVDNDVLHRALQGYRLNRHEAAELNEGVSAAKLDDDLIGDFDPGDEVWDAVKDYYDSRPHVKSFSRLTENQKSEAFWDYFDRESRLMRKAINALRNNEDSQSIFRQAVASGEVELRNLDRAHMLFGESMFTPKVQEKILFAWADNQEDGGTFAVSSSKHFTLNEMFELYDTDEQFTGINESVWWAWFRELFYA